MASGFPYDSSGNEVTDAFSNPISSNNLSSPNHAVLHSDVNDAITRIESVLQGRSGNRNLLYNGAMQVHQRVAVSTGVTGITTFGMYSADRWYTQLTTLGTWTQSVEADAPTGSGFRKSLKMLCTTADAAPAVSAECRIMQMLEGQDVQAIRKGTSAAEQLVVSFWVKSTQTGTFIFELFETTNLRQISKSYTISSAGVWEFKTLTFPADTTGAIANTTDLLFRASWWLGAGSSYTSGSLNSTTWATSVDANRAVGQANVAANTNAYWQVTGLQITVGPYQQPFEFKSYERELRECQRYYYRMSSPAATYTRFGVGMALSTLQAVVTIFFPVTMRTSPTALDQSGTASHYALAGSTGTALVCSSVPALNVASTHTADVTFNVASGLTAGNATYAVANATASAYLGWSAE